MRAIHFMNALALSVNGCILEAMGHTTVATIAFCLATLSVILMIFPGKQRHADQLEAKP